MPNLKSAIKRMRQNAKRRAHNRAQRSALRTSIKKIRATIAEGDAQGAKDQLQNTISVIDKAAQKGLIHKNKAARYGSRLTKEINALGAKAAS